MRRALAAGCIVAVILAIGVTPAHAKKRPLEQFLVEAQAPGDSQSVTTPVLQVNIYKWSTADDLEAVTDAIEEAAENRRAYRAVHTALGSLGKAGYMFMLGGQGWPIRYAQERQVDGKRQILLATDRPLTFTEIYRGSAVREYDITLIVLTLDDSSTGDGVVSVGTEVEWNEAKGQLEITNTSSQPVRLGNVRPVE